MNCEFPNCDCAERSRNHLAGITTACDEKIERLTPYVLGIVRNILGDAHSEDWDDAVQEVFLKVFRRLHLWEERCPFCQWVRLVAVRHALDLRETARVRHLVRSLPPSYDIAVPESKAPPDLSDCPEKVLAEVRSEWRQVFDLTYKGEMSRQAVAVEMGVSIRTVQYWLSQILDRMRDCVEKL